MASKFSHLLQTFSELKNNLDKCKDVLEISNYKLHAELT
jgi:hypothetical protein